MDNKGIIAHENTVEIKEEALSGAPNVMIKQPEEVQNALLLKNIKLEQELSDDKFIEDFDEKHIISSLMTRGNVKKEFKQNQIKYEFINYECDLSSLKEEDEEPEAGPSKNIKLKQELSDNFIDLDKAHTISSLITTGNVKKEFKQDQIKSGFINYEFDLPYLKEEDDPEAGAREQFKVDTKSNKKKYFCPVCQKYHRSYKSMKKHFKGHFRKELALCYCGRFFTEAVLFSWHYFGHYLKKCNNFLKFPAKKYRKIKVHDKKHKEYPNTSITDHSVNNTNEKPCACGICLRPFPFTMLTRHEIDSRKELHACKSCLKQIAKKERCGEKCNICLKHFSCRSVLAIHSRIHTGEKPFKCKICLKQYSSSTALIRHSRIHTGEKPFKCVYCLKQFSCNSNLTKHSRTHTGEKPHKCNICLKQFSQKQGLVYHSRVHTGEKPNKCKMCLKRLPSSANLTAHSRICPGKNMNQCQICLKQFTTKSYLTLHSRVHTGETPFKCKVCLKQFCTKQNLLKHSETHIGDKPYCKCEICSKQFTSKQYLFNHYRTHSGKRK